MHSCAEVQKLIEKVLTRRGKKWYNNGAVNERRQHRRRNRKGEAKASEKNLKKFEKPLDKRNLMWYNKKVAEIEFDKSFEKS